MHKRQKIMGDNVYSLLLPPVRQVMPLCSRVAVLIGPVLATLGADVGKGGMDKFASVVVNVDADKLDALIMDAVIVSKLSCGNTPISMEIDFEKHFSNHRAEVYEVTLWVLWEIVKDFFPQAPAITQIFKEKVDQEFPYQNLGETNTG